MGSKRNPLLMFRLHIATQILLVVFFFLRGGRWLLSSYNANWAYIFDQVALPALAIVLAFSWHRKKLLKKNFLKRKSLLKVDWVVVLLISLVIILTHYYSFYRVIFDEWNNIVKPIILLDKNVQPPLTEIFFFSRERYVWWPFVLLYKTFGFVKPNSMVLGTAGVFMTILASLAGAWLAWVISKRRAAALLTGLLVGISPNTFASLFNPSNVLGDNFGIIMVSLTVGTWFIARRDSDKRGLFISLLLLAATLKSGGAVRTMTVGSLLILTDLVFFWKKIRHNFIVPWTGVVGIGALFYLTNPAVQIGTADSANVSHEASLIVRGAQLLELVARSFFSPAVLKKLIPFLSNLNLSSPNYFWIVTIGALTFIAGWVVSLFLFFRGRSRILLWCWCWFFLTIFYVPWSAEGYGTSLNSIDSRSGFTDLFPGFRYAYIPLLGVHIALGIALDNLLKQKKWRKVALLIITTFMVFRAGEFLKYEYKWYTDMSVPGRSWQKAVFEVLPPETIDSSKDFKVVIVDGVHNPMSGVGGWVGTAIYAGKHVLFYESVDEFYLDWIKSKTPLDQVYAFGWDSGKQEEVNISDAFRRWLLSPESVTKKFSDISQAQEELDIPLPNPGQMILKVELGASTDTVTPGSHFKAALLCNTDHGKKKEKEMFWKQRTLEDWLSRSQVKFSVPNSGKKQTLTSPIKCEGGRLKRIVFEIPAGFPYKIEGIEISFPAPIVKNQVYAN